MRIIAQQFILSNFKGCPKCKRVLPLSEFHKSRNRSDGLQTYCKPCSYIIARKWIEGNREHVQARRRRRYEREGEEAREQWRKWREEKLSGPDAKEWWEKRKQDHKQYAKTYRERYPDRRLASTQKRRAVVSASEEHFTAEEWTELCERYDNRCLACGRKCKLTADHIVPLSKGGSNGIDNIQPLCGSCNSSKKAKIIDYRK